MEELLRQGEFLEFFIEGQRTRSGKAVYPKAGLLSVVVDTLKNGMFSLYQLIFY
jgi:glycerol-3-phosphate O-acyltransferase